MEYAREGQWIRNAHLEPLKFGPSPAARGARRLGFPTGGEAKSRDSSLLSRMTQGQKPESEMSSSTIRDSTFHRVQGSPLPKEA